RFVAIPKYFNIFCIIISHQSLGRFVIIMRIMQMKFPVPTRQFPKWPTYFPAHILKVLLQAFHPKHAVHSNVSAQADPIHLRTPAVNSRTDFRSPAPWFIMERVGERGSHPFSKPSGLAALIHSEKFLISRRILPLLKIIIGQHAIPRVADNGKLKVVGQYLWLQFISIIQKIFMFLPLHTEKAIYAFSSCFRNVNKNTAVLMIDHW